MDEYDALERHQELVHELAAGRWLNTFDSAAVDAVAALVVRREQCQRILAAAPPGTRTGDNAGAGGNGRTCVQVVGEKRPDLFMGTLWGVFALYRRIADQITL